ncbi:MAG: glutamyl-tRNA synthetase [Candidatus Bathyarchaeota archaeon B24]|nr:MAG: glutamyl-tRNA synthetase [Candidatus Bathyarchaeota archaeon B24]
MEDSVKPIAWKYALLNAYRHGGKAKPGPVLGKVLAERPELKKRVKDVLKLVERVVEEVNRLTVEEQRRIIEERFPELLARREREAEAKTLPPLPNVDKYKTVVTRYAPNPDFVLHFGQARAIYLSHDYARMYKGRFILRFEDTDPKNKKPVLEYYDAIREDIRWLGCRWDEEHIQSLRMPIYYEYARKLIELGAGYVCTCEAKTFKQLVLKGEPCPCRGLTVEENLERWDRMLEGLYGEGEAVLRVKTDLNHPNPSVREWVAFRVIDTSRNPHPLVGDKYTVWPTYHFANGLDDHLMGITHIIRGKEFLSALDRHLYLYKHFGWRYPEAIHYGRWMLPKGGTMSKSKILKAIKAGLFKGVDDPRLPTLAALRRRGIQPEAIHRMIIDVGVKQAEVSLSWENLYAYNRQVVEPRARRLFFVHDPVKLLVHKTPKSYEAKVRFHPSRPDMGYRTIHVKAEDGLSRLLICKDDVKLLESRGMVRLMELFNVRLLKVSEDLVEVEFLSEGYGEARRLRLPLIHWLPEDRCLKARVVMPDASEVEGFVEDNVAQVEVGEVIQFERFGFVRLDSVDDEYVFYYAHK